jgi:hypothetical protein
MHLMIKESLGIDDDTWNTFSSNSGSMFVPRPSNNPPPVTQQVENHQLKNKKELMIYLVNILHIN